MSVAASSHFSNRPKRAFEEPDAREPSSPGPGSLAKRLRCCSRSPSVGRCTNFAGYHVSQSSVAALLSLFPEMEEQTVISVLSDCGDNIDAAIKRLGQLRLCAEEAAGSSVPSASGTHGNIREQQDASLSGAAGPQTPDEWVEVLVQEMGAAVDVADARQRAAHVLAMFDKFSAERRGRDQEKEALMAKLQELQKESHILKRAVQIQNTKLQEKAQQDQEVQQLRMMLGQYQEQVRTLELNNYSLALHLQQATNSATLATGSRPPDVF